jgi:hypothetical protein
MTVSTAVDGGHIGKLDDTNAVIRKVVEARNKAREQQHGAPIGDDDGELDEELRKACDMSQAEPLAGVFDRTDADNPKDIIGSGKLPLHLWPTTATAMGCVALLNGALKYGRSNWREVGVKASIYVDACQRHLAAWFEGEEADEEGVPHLSSALACLAILVDCEAAGLLKDDRQYPGGHRQLIEKLTPHVARLRDVHASKSPKHYTIGNGTPVGEAAGTT